MPLGFNCSIFNLIVIRESILQLGPKRREAISKERPSSNAGMIELISTSILFIFYLLITSISVDFGSNVVPVAGVFSGSMDTGMHECKMPESEPFFKNKKIKKCMCCLMQPLCFSHDDTDVRKIS